MSTTTDITATAAAAAATTTTISRALTRALEANEAAEKAIIQELKNLAAQKAQNRNKAAQLTHALLLVSLLPNTSTDADIKELQQEKQQQQPSLDTNKSLENTYQPWNRIYFTDGTSVPEPNADTVARRQTVTTTQAFFYHINPPWLTKECKILLDLVQQHQQQQEKLKSLQQQKANDANSTTATATTKIDFDNVAMELHQCTHPVIRGRNASFPSATAKPRSALECEIEYNRQIHEQHQNDNKKKNKLLLSFNNISKAISSLSATSTATADTPSTRQGIDWQAVAIWLQEHENIQTSAWECFAEYQKASRGRRKNDSDSSNSSGIEPWTVKQDEVLLKYVAAMGPQALVDGHAMNHLLSRLLPNKSKSQILNRINHSLLNPSLRHDTWSGDEERLLTVCMKMYYSTSTTDTTNNAAATDKHGHDDAKTIEKQALYLAGTHLPHRATASVLHKWHRTLNPDYDTGPFTKAEDDKLLRVMRASTSTTTNQQQQQQQQQQPLGWKELAQLHFPNRHAHRLMNRWSEIASNQDIIARFSSSGKKDKYLQMNHPHDDNDDDMDHNKNSNKRSSTSSRHSPDTANLVLPIKKKKS